MEVTKGTDVGRLDCEALSHASTIKFSAYQVMLALLASIMGPRCAHHWAQTMKRPKGRVLTENRQFPCDPKNKSKKGRIRANLLHDF